MLGLYTFTEKGMHANESFMFAKTLLRLILGMVLIQALLRKELFSKIWIPSIIIGFNWTVVMVILYSFSDGFVFEWNPSHDIIWGVYFMIFSMLLESILMIVKTSCPPHSVQM